MIVQFLAAIVVQDIAPPFCSNRPMLFCRVVSCTVSGINHRQCSIRPVPCFGLRFFEERAEAVAVQLCAFAVLPRVAFESTEVNERGIDINQRNRMLGEAARLRYALRPDNKPWSLVTTMMVLSLNGLLSTASTTRPIHSSTAATLARYA